MYFVYIRYAGCCEQVSDKPMGLMAACNLIDDNHAETDRDLKMILKKSSLRGFHQQVLERRKAGDDYDIVSARTGELMMTAHRDF